MLSISLVVLEMFEFRPSLSFVPKRVNPPSLRNWLGHVPFVADLIADVRPEVVVELGTHYGESYFGMCQAVEEAGVDAKCWAVDTWAGDYQSGLYGEEVFREVEDYNATHYGGFSRLLRMSFGEALSNFADDTIGLLHIDGLHTYEAVSRDFWNWIGKVRPGGIVLLHDIEARHADFGVWRLWAELAQQFPSLAFRHSWGLGVVQKPSASCHRLFSLSGRDTERLRLYYEHCALRLSEQRQETAVRLFVPSGDRSLELVGAPRSLSFGDWHEMAFACRPGAASVSLYPSDCPALIDIRDISFRTIEFGDEILFGSGTESRSLSVTGSAMRLAGKQYLSLLSTGRDPRIGLSLPPSDSGGLLRVALRARRDIQDCVEQIAGWAESHGATERLQEELSRCDEQRRAAMAELARVERQEAETAERLAQVQAECTRERERCAAATAEQQRLTAELAQLASWRSAVCASWSWRLSGPLRWFGGLLLKIKP